MINYFDLLSASIGAELIASIQYSIASNIVEGTDYSDSSSEFKEHSHDEWQHFYELMNASVERNIAIELDIPTLINRANPAYEQLTTFDSGQLVNFFIRQEENAIKSYQELYEIIKDEDITLADLIKKIWSDEIGHRKDLNKLASSIFYPKNITEFSKLGRKRNIMKNFSKLNRKLNQINFDDVVYAYSQDFDPDEFDGISEYLFTKTDFKVIPSYNKGYLEVSLYNKDKDALEKQVEKVFGSADDFEDLVEQTKK